MRMKTKIEIKKEIRQILCMLLLCFFLLPIGVKAQEAEQQLTDQAGLLTDQESEEIRQQIEELEQASGWDVMALTSNDAEGMDGTAYAETWFDQHTTKDDGVICVIDMDNREITVRAFGDCRFYITDNRTERILDAGYEAIQEERYGDTLKAMLREVKTAYEREEPGKNHLYDEDTEEITTYQQEKQRGITRLEFLIAAAAAVAAGGITVGGIIGKYRLKFGGYKYPIEKNSSLNLRNQKDHLVNEFVTHRHIERESSSGSKSGGSRSTVHKGAGGRSSSGGSRKF